jgi:hypothetical protein
MIRIKRARRSRIILSLSILPIFLVMAVWFSFSGFWQVALITLGAWVFFLFATSLLFQAFIIIILSVYAFYLHKWLPGIVGFFLSVYLIYVNRMTDEKLLVLTNQIKIKYPTLERIINFFDNHDRAD